MVRQEYYQDPGAPPANSLTPTAFAAVRDDAGCILLVRRMDTGNWELPGGRVELGESADVAAEREVAEESGMIIRITDLLGVYSDPGHIMVYPATGEARQQFAVLPRSAGRGRSPTRPRRDLRSGVGPPPAGATYADAPEHAAAGRRRPVPVAHTAQRAPVRGSVRLSELSASAVTRSGRVSRARRTR
jgi:ADP-ribose pyrophosphatase YjhB (NUDIX family)